MTTETTETTGTKQQHAPDSNLVEVGAIWLKQDKNGNTFFSMTIGDEHFLGFKPKTEKEGNPDYWLRKPTASGQLEFAGRAVKGTTANGRVKLDLTLTGRRKYLAIYRDAAKVAPEGSKMADMTVFEKAAKPSAKAGA